MFYKCHVVVTAVLLILFRHGKLWRSYKMECRIEMPHGCNERVDCASIFKVSDKIDAEILKCALRLID